MATVAALQSFVGVLEKDVLNPERKEESSLGVSVFPGTVKKEGRKVEVVKGQLFEDNHPAVKAFPTMFGQPALVSRGVEQATSAPGEKR